MHFENQPHIPSATPGVSIASFTSMDTPHRAKKHRGSYNCGRCGLPKKGHVCHLPPSTTTTPTQTPTDSSVSVSTSTSRPPPPSRQQHSDLRRALSFDDNDLRCDSPEIEIDEPELDLSGSGSGKLPVSCMWEILRRLSPEGLLAAARKCSGLSRLSLRLESDVDATMLACIAFSCPNLEVMDISTSETLVNRITGDELGRFVANKRCLTSLKMEGCSNLGGLVLCSSSLSTLWLSDLYCLSKMVFNCPNLKEISLDFSRQENESTDLIAMVDGLGRTCPRLQNIHVASFRLSHATVLALTAANLRGLRMLSLVFGTEITDASVASISQSYSKLELLDLSGSSISDSGIGMICNVFPGTLSRFLLAVCPNITSSGIQFATAQLPLLELMDCGMTICDLSPQNPTYDESELIDLNLNSCKNLHPDRVLLQCPRLERVHASGCQKLLIGAIQSQVSSNDLEASENQFLNKRLADGSKRVRVPLFLSQQPYDEDKKRRRIGSRPCKILVD
ncbi:MITOCHONDRIAL ATP SYNTHASE COUPLING FACTOR B [Salix koriyanagi]|uniref:MITOCHONDRIAL ATP SYNTHASE COUPLING FACTOR B n=1 Tax=Salix koriyanagi TaxID=2511006 RepID=A0A9Q0P420_9ROSI|nr:MITOCHONDRIAL ATP SYNTHASE COUPLING FACTOR B [Salix koriyanagi]